MDFKDEYRDYKATDDVDKTAPVFSQRGHHSHCLNLQSLTHYLPHSPPTHFDPVHLQYHSFSPGAPVDVAVISAQLIASEHSPLCIKTLHHVL